MHSKVVLSLLLIVGLVLEANAYYYRRYSVNRRRRYSSFRRRRYTFVVRRRRYVFVTRRRRHIYFARRRYYGDERVDEGETIADTFPVGSMFDPVSNHVPSRSCLRANFRDTGYCRR